MKLHITKYLKLDRVHIDSGINELFETTDGIKNLISNFIDQYETFLDLDQNVEVICSEVRNAKLYIKLSEEENILFVDDVALQRRNFLKDLIERLKELVKPHPYLEPFIKPFEDELIELERYAVKLGEFIPRYDKKNDDFRLEIILYRKPIINCASNYGCTTKELATIVLVHEFIHALFDSKLKYVAEKEEPLAEMGSIHFFKEKENDYPKLFNIAYIFCKDKLNCTYLKHYGFGATLYDITDADMRSKIIKDYRNRMLK